VKEIMADEPSFENPPESWLKQRAGSWAEKPLIVYDSIKGELYRATESEAAGML
jgi:hypothetical protein